MLRDTRRLAALLQASTAPVCVALAFAACTPFADLGPSEDSTVVELCNRVDDDGDGSIDEDFDLANSVRDCGACGQRCGGEHAIGECVGGWCELTCLPGYGDCNGLREDGCETSLRRLEDCGACGRACGEGQICADGRCEDTCPPSAPWTCGETCADLASDVEHCGACNRPCEVLNGVPSCVEGRCAIGACEDGFVDCDGDPTNGCESDLRDPESCALCGNVCEATETCAVAGCVCAIDDEDEEQGALTCGELESCCPDAGCVNFAVDPDNCGSCGNECGLGEYCCEGRCSRTAGGYRRSEESCGGCGPSGCGATEQCCDGACIPDDLLSCENCPRLCG